MLRTISISLLVAGTMIGLDQRATATTKQVHEPQRTPTDEIPAATGWRMETVITGLEHPWALAFLSEDQMLITERSGQLRVVDQGNLRPTSVENVPDVFAQGQGGLMDVSLHPDFERNRLIYLTLSAGDRDANQTTLVRARLGDDLKALENVNTIFRVSPAKPGTQHFGSRILWLRDQTLLMSIGDGGNPPVKLEDEYIRKQAQQLSSHLGSIVRLNDDGSPAQGNPYASRQNAKPAIWSYGHRNIQGMTIDPKTHRVWATEHGARGGDELNLIEKGANYGWPEVTFSREYFGPEITEHRSKPGMVDPYVVWTPALAPSGLAFYSAEHFPDWRGDLLAGGLVSEIIVRIDLEGSRVRGQQSLQIGQRVRDIRIGPDGHVYVLTDEADGQLLRIKPKP